MFSLQGPHANRHDPPHPHHPPGHRHIKQNEKGEWVDSGSNAQFVEQIKSGDTIFFHTSNCTWCYNGTCSNNSPWNIPTASGGNKNDLIIVILNKGYFVISCIPGSHTKEENPRPLVPHQNYAVDEFIKNYISLIWLEKAIYYSTDNFHNFTIGRGNGQSENLGQLAPGMWMKKIYGGVFHDYNDNIIPKISDEFQVFDNTDKKKNLYSNSACHAPKSYEPYFLFDKNIPLDYFLMFQFQGLSNPIYARFTPQFIESGSLHNALKIIMEIFLAFTTLDDPMLRDIPPNGFAFISIGDRRPYAKWKADLKIPLNGKPDTFVIMRDARDVAFVRIAKNAMEDRRLTQTIFDIRNILHHRNKIASSRASAHVIFPVDEKLREKNPAVQANFRQLFDQIIAVHTPGQFATWDPYCYKKHMTESELFLDITLSSKRPRKTIFHPLQKFGQLAIGEMDMCIETFDKSTTVRTCFASMEWAIFTTQKDLPHFLESRQGIVINLDTYQQFDVSCPDFQESFEETIVVLYDSLHCIICRYPRGFDNDIDVWNKLGRFASTLLKPIEPWRLVTINSNFSAWPGANQFFNTGMRVAWFPETCLLSIIRSDHGLIEVAGARWDGELTEVPIPLRTLSFDID
ncbi:uncharacterized protein TRUGW13939_10451 [Talaromyces rugulosus]|uniref:Uncharacterized protein n=1 Tax=Talaromyces rugulosus TaxID=121627 RepID=A0A7H8RA69_TALRU|nr:uncharacterized protein TRUGW13939_10451 [Talaromyces rugulosus]QKX63282.1 hypothetical protein TRUGW13939_10451 [Talaromyces rugulosus]